MVMIGLMIRVQKIRDSLTQLFNHKQSHKQEAQLSALLLENAALKDVITREIEARKRIGDDLLALQERQEALLKAMPDLMIRLNKQGIYLDIHAPRPEMLIAPAEEILGRNISDFLPEQALEIHEKNINQVLATGQDATYDYSLPLNGIMSHFESHMVLSGQDEVLSIVRNITEQRRMEKQDSEFLRDMKALQEISFTLSQINDMEVLYASMVRLIKESLDIDRVAVFIIDPKTGILKGTYGVGPDGNIRAEHDYREVITDQHWTHDVMNSPIRTYLRENIPLYEKGIQIADG